MWKAENSVKNAHMGEKISLSFRKDKNKYFRRQITVAGALVHFKNFKTI